MYRFETPEEQQIREKLMAKPGRGTDTGAPHGYTKKDIDRIIRWRRRFDLIATRSSPMNEDERIRIIPLTERSRRKRRRMPHFKEQDRPKHAKEIYYAIKGSKAGDMRRRYGSRWKAVAARIASRQYPPGPQPQGPPYSGPLTRKKR